MKTTTSSSLLFLLFITSFTTFAQKEIVSYVDGFPIYSSRSIYENGSNVASISNFTKLLNASELGQLVKNKENYTVFFPNNKAFAKISNQFTEDLLKLENFDKLQKFVGGFIVKGKLNFNAISNAIKIGNGKAVIKTISGDSICFTSKIGYLVATDTNGTVATIIQNDIANSNGTLFVLDNLIFPKATTEIIKEGKPTYSLN